MRLAGIGARAASLAVQHPKRVGRSDQRRRIPTDGNATCEVILRALRLHTGSRAAEVEDGDGVVVGFGNEQAPAVC